MSATRAFTLRSTLRAACRRPIQSQARLVLSRRGYASVQGAAHEAAHKAGSDLPWLATAAVITVPTLSYLLFSGPEKKSHDEHVAEAHHEHGVTKPKPQGKQGEDGTPEPTSETDTGDAESKGHVVGNKPEDLKGGHEDSEKGAQPQDPKPNKPSSDDSDKKARGDADKEDKDDEKKDKDDDKKNKNDDKEGDKKSADDAAEKKDDKKQSDEKAANQKGSDENADKGKTDSSGKDSKKKGGEMDDSTDSQAQKLSEKSPSKRVNATDK